MRVVRSILAIANKDIQVWLRQPAAIAVTLMPAVVFILVVNISAAAVGHNPVALVNLDHGPAADRMAAVLRSSDAFRVVEAEPSGAARMLNDLAVSAVVTIPDGFSARLAAGQPDPVEIRVNNLNLDFTNDLRRSLPAAITRFYAESGADPILVHVRETDLRTRDVSLVQFQLVPVLVLLLTVAGIVNCGTATAREFEERTVKELLLAPNGPAAIIGGKLLAGWATTFLVAMLVVAGAALTGILRPAGWYWLETAGLVALIALMTAGLGAALGSRARSFGPVAGVGINASIWLFFLSGGISVAAFLPGWVQLIAAFTPTYYGVHALEQAIFYSSVDGLGLDLTVLGATAVAALALGALSVRRSVVG